MILDSWNAMDPEVKKALLQFALLLVGFVLTVGVGHWVASYWAERQKRRELELALANNFYNHYGEFRAVWRQWNMLLNELPKGSDELNKAREGLHDRASRAEGGLESVLLKIASERVLDETAQANLGNLRQAF